MARLLGRAGQRVLAIDGDSNPNLAMTLGIDMERLDALPTLTRDLLRRTPEGSELTKGIEEICDSHSLPAPDRVTLLVMAHPQHAGTG